MNMGPQIRNKEKEKTVKNRKPQLFKTIGALLAVSTLSIPLALSTAVARAASYPSKPVRLITTTAPGGITNEVARLIATKLSERLGKQIVVDSRSGGGGIVATEIASKAEPDGYTLLFATGTHTTHTALQRKLPYDPIKSFAPIAKLGSGPFALVVHPTVPAKSMKELIELARQKPGELLFATAGLGGSAHLGAELLKIMANIDFRVVHFRGGGPAMIDLLGNHSDAGIGALSQYLPHINSGKLRVLGTTGLKRSAILPDVPSIVEAAGLPGYEITIWWGILAPVGTPASTVNRLDKELRSILASDEVKRWFLAQGAEVGYMGPTDFGLFIKEQITKWTSVVKKANIKVE